MKKWFYIIAPAAMLAVFSFFYVTHVKETREKDRIRKEEVAKQIAQEATRKAEIEEQARLDAAARAADREAKAAEKETERIAKGETEGREIQETTDEYNKAADKLAHEQSELEVQLEQLRRAKERANNEVLALAKQVELARIDKRNAELEIQRKTEMVVRQVQRNSLTQMPSIDVTAR